MASEVPKKSCSIVLHEDHRFVFYDNAQYDNDIEIPSLGNDSSPAPGRLKNGRICVMDNLVWDTVRERESDRDAAARIYDSIFSGNGKK